MPLIWASRIQGTPLPARVAGSDLVVTLASALAKADRTLFLLGGQPGIAVRAADSLRERNPGIQVVGTHCPPYGYEDDPIAMDKIRSSLAQAKPDFVYVGLPFPKASALVAELRDALPQTWFLGIGISFSFICGDVVRAPRWVQRTGLEWVHRLIQEPRRLGRRYILEGLPFAAQLMLSASAKRRRARRSR
jgi:N-acetylglucosaminyldiphosphoundecaprenol N-acetyl-beta-D-mannosaminyltransferase